jgi:hypothetical protein
VLSCFLPDGREIIACNAFGVEGSPDMSAAEVEEQMDRLLGRAADGRRPRRLAWSPLVLALKDAGVESSEEELIAAPFEARFQPSADLDRDP